MYVCMCVCACVYIYTINTFSDAIFSLGLSFHKLQFSFLRTYKEVLI